MVAVRELSRLLSTSIGMHAFDNSDSLDGFASSAHGHKMPKGKKGLSAEQQAELKEAFDLFDADKSGQIDVRARSRGPFASIFCARIYDRGHDC